MTVIKLIVEIDNYFVQTTLNKIQYLDYVLSEDYKSFYIKLLFITLLLVFSIGYSLLPLMMVFPVDIFYVSSRIYFLRTLVRIFLPLQVQIFWKTIDLCFLVFKLCNMILMLRVWGPIPNWNIFFWLLIVCFPLLSVYCYCCCYCRQ